MDRSRHGFATKRRGFAIRAPGINKKSTDLSIRAWSRHGFAMRAGYKQKKTLTFQ